MLLEIILSLLFTASFTIIVLLLFITYYVNLILRIYGFSNIDLSVPLDVETLNKELQSFGFAYDEENDFFFSTMHPWQRKYGYGRPYDEIAPFISLIYDCEPIVFEYNNKKWMIEFWKGQYGMTTGAEIGIYATDEDTALIKSIIFESVTDNELLSLSYVLKKKNSIILTRNDKHWWLTGFKLGDFSRPSDLVMSIAITFDNYMMCEAFVNGLIETGYMNEELEIINNSVYLTFSKPYTKQPLTRLSFITYFMQKYNKYNCRLYNHYTKNYDNTLDKLNYIRIRMPFLYTQIMNIGQNEQLFKSLSPLNRSSSR